MDNVIENTICQELDIQTPEFVNSVSEFQAIGENIGETQYVFEIPSGLLQVGDNGIENIQYATIFEECDVAISEQQPYGLNSDGEEKEELELTTLQMMEVDRGNDYGLSMNDDELSSYSLADHVQRAAIIAARQAEDEKHVPGKRCSSKKKMRLTKGSLFVDSEENDESESGDEAEQYDEYANYEGIYTLHREAERGEIVEGAKLKLAQDGSIVLDNDNLNVDKTKNQSGMESTMNDYMAGYGNTPNYKHWSLDETCRFYKLLNTIGSDFSLMENHFLNRNRTSIKRKYKREEKVRSELVDKAMRMALGSLTHEEIMNVLTESAEYGKVGKGKRTKRSSPQKTVSSVPTQTDDGSVSDESMKNAGAETGTEQPNPKRRRDRKVFFDKILYV